MLTYQHKSRLDRIYTFIMNLDEFMHTYCNLVELYAIITQSITQSRRAMYDDYDLDYTFSSDYTLDEYTYADTGILDLDEDYARDTHDYQDLAYRHYA